MNNGRYISQEELYLTFDLITEIGLHDSLLRFFEYNEVQEIIFENFKEFISKIFGEKEIPEDLKYRFECELFCDFEMGLLITLILLNNELESIELFINEVKQLISVTPPYKEYLEYVENSAKKIIELQFQKFKSDQQSFFKSINSYYFN